MRKKCIKMLSMLFTGDETVDSSSYLFLLFTFLYFAYFQRTHFHTVIFKNQTLPLIFKNLHLWGRLCMCGDRGCMENLCTFC